jgi:hypothetical protein
MIAKDKQKENVIVYEAEHDDDGKTLRQVLEGKLDFRHLQHTLRICNSNNILSIPIRTGFEEYKDF